MIAEPTHERFFAVLEALRRGTSVEEIAKASDIDTFWLYEMLELVELENRLRTKPTLQDAQRAREAGYSKAGIESLARQADVDFTLPADTASFRMVDTAAAEFPAQSPYYYISRGEQDEMRKLDKPAVVVVGSGPIRIGQGIEFDYSCVHAAWALQARLLAAAVVVNNNPETVSTDFDVSDALIFEPPGPDEVQAAYDATNAAGVMLAFGGQTAINLAEELARRGLRIIGSDRTSVDMAEDRDKFDEALQRLGVARPQGRSATSFRQARVIARELGFPVLVRPSYVLGGRGMEIVYNEGQLASYVETATPPTASAPLLVDKYLPGLELEVDAVYDGEDILIPGIFEHIERAGIHSGDSITVYPPRSIDAATEQRIVEITRAIAHELRTRGLINIQFVLHEGELLIIEANPRASRTAPIISKAVGVNLIEAAVRVGLGEKLRDMGYTQALLPRAPFTVVKVPVFSFAKMRGVETILGPEMKSTGEVLGIDDTFGGALRKGFIAAGMRRKPGRVLVSIPDSEKAEAVDILRRFANCGYTLVATQGTHAMLEASRIPLRSASIKSPKVRRTFWMRSLRIRSTWLSTTRLVRAS